MNVCPECHQPMDKICEECGVTLDEPEYVVHDLYNYIARPHRCYKREDHFKEVLAQFQGNEGKVLPPELLNQIRDEIKDNEITLSEIRRVLRKLRLTNYVENLFSINFALTGQQPPYIKREIQDKIVKMFKQIARAYDDVAKYDRRSFLNYYFIIFKLLELMGQVDLLPQVPMLKTKMRIKEHDAIWRKICEELDWSFHPTILK